MTANFPNSAASAPDKYALVPASVVNQIIKGNHNDVFAVLGMHAHDSGCRQVTVFLPGAQAAILEGGNAELGDAKGGKDPPELIITPEAEDSRARPSDYEPPFCCFDGFAHILAAADLADNLTAIDRTRHTHCVHAQDRPGLFAQRCGGN